MKNLMVYTAGQYHGPFTYEDAVLFISNVNEEPRLFELVERPVNVTYSCVLKQQPLSSTIPPVPEHEYGHVDLANPQPRKNIFKKNNTKGQFG